MAFKRDHFAPVSITTTKAPSIFVYHTDEDTLVEIMRKGYFNGMRIAIKVNSMIDVVCVDAAARLIVGAPEGLNVVIRPDYFQSSVPVVKEIKLSPQQRAAITRKKKKEELLLSKTG